MLTDVTHRQRLMPSAALNMGITHWTGRVFKWGNHRDGLSLKEWRRKFFNRIRPCRQRSQLSA
jgi:hypothetical protein